MQRVAAAGLVALVGVVALMSVGCVSEEKYNSVLLRNREQDKLLQDKDSQVATLTERVNALTASRTDAQRLLAEKDDHLATVMKERDAVKSAFDQLLANYNRLVERPSGVSGSGIPAEVTAQIQQLAEQYPGVFDFDQATGRLRFNADITFDSGSNAVKPDARAAITKLGGILSAEVAMDIRVEIVGHTDIDKVRKPATIELLKQLGKATSNQGLSEARAEAVADILKTAKVDASRVTTKGVGESQPVDARPTAEGKAKNRRVEIYLTGTGTAAPAAAPAAAKPAAPAF
jgi:chemotaxis protein MotB